MSFLAQMLSILIKEKKLFLGVECLFHFSVCLKIKWLVTLSAHITKCRQVFCVLKMIPPQLQCSNSQLSFCRPCLFSMET